MARNLISFDWAMKRLLRSKANYKVLEGFLSELLKRNVKIEEILESESNRDTANDKYNIVDILVRLDGKELVIIEVQADAQFDYFHRMLYGVAKIITDHMDLGAKYHEVKKVFSVSIVYFDLGNGTDYIYHCKSEFIGLNDQSKFNLTEKQKELYQKEYIYDIHPEYYIIKVNQFNDLAKNTLDEWIYFFKT